MVNPRPPYGTLNLAGLVSALNSKLPVFRPKVVPGSFLRRFYSPYYKAWIVQTTNGQFNEKLGKFFSKAGTGNYYV